MTERYRLILHKTHDWIGAPEHGYFELRGKMVYLVETTDPEPGTVRSYPWGTAWRASSIIAFSDPLPPHDNTATVKENCNKAGISYPNPYVHVVRGATNGK